MRQPERSDVELMQAIARRDQGALEVLYGRYGGRVKAVALYIVRDEATAEEVVQDVFVNACWRDARAYDPAKGRSVFGWLYVAAQRLSLNALRHRRPAQRAELSWPEGELPWEPADPAAAGATDAVDERLDADALAPAIRACLAALNADQRQAVLLASLRGLSHGEIAQAVGAPRRTIQTRIRDGMRHLRKCLLGRGVTEP
jgi:RNA polymerase sigma-70 factor (ECF subfamily)